MRLATGLAGLLLAVSLAGCGSAPATPGPGGGDGGGDAPDSTAADPGQRALRFARCLREHGVNVPDPDPGKPGQIPLGGPGTDQQKMQEAVQACRQFSPIGGSPPSADHPAGREARLKFAACMREHGVENWPDPSAASGPVMIGPELTGDPDFESAAQACQPLLREAFGDTF